jgi:ADP-heptose:LPS heptosyltransferase
MNRSQRILIYRLGSLGDTVVALPCFHKIAQTWPNAERIVLTNRPVNSKAAPLEAVLGRGGLIHRTVTYPVGIRSLTGLMDLGRHIRSLEADVLVYLAAPRGLPNTLRDALFFKWCGFDEIIGLPYTHDLQQCRYIESPWNSCGGAQEYECERLARCIASLGPIDLEDPKMWDLRLTEREIRAGDAMLDSLAGAAYFAINTGGKINAKDWGLRNWQKLLARLTREYRHMGLVIVGAADDSVSAQLLARAWSGPVVDLCGKVSPRESAAALRHAVGFIGHDSGPLHLAAAMGVPCVGLFGNLNVPNRWHPRGARHRIIHRMAGLERITVGEVEAAVRAIASPLPLQQRHKLANRIPAARADYCTIVPAVTLSPRGV